MAPRALRRISRPGARHPHARHRHCGAAGSRTLFSSPASAASAKPPPRAFWPAASTAKKDRPPNRAANARPASRFARDAALDVVEIDGATYRKIDDARAIIENLSYRPARDRFKIYIIDEAHQLTDQAFNALLKTLEEPPAHVKFILATTEPQKMPETILSRLQRYDFRRIPLDTTLARLKELAKLEEIEAEESALRLLAREAGGSMRDAERMLETAIAALGKKIAESEIAASLGVAGRGAVFKLAEAILNHDAAAALGAVREQHRRGANLESLGRDLLETLRNLAVAKLPAGDELNPLVGPSRSRGGRAAADSRARQRARPDAAVQTDGRCAGTDHPFVVPRPAAGDDRRANGDAGAGHGRGRIAARAGRGGRHTARHA